MVHRSENVFVKINPRWRPGNPGSVLVMPVDHYENIFDLPGALAAPIHTAARSAATAMKVAFGCDGISLRQHNEPAGSQDVWHYHLHVIPRWHGDDFDRHPARVADAEAIRLRAQQLRNAWTAPT